MNEAVAFRLSCGLPALLYLGTLAVCSSSVIADGYDGIGFALALDRFDLLRFEPHPPGYPLFVLLGRAVYRLGLRPGVALAVVSALLLGLGLAGFADSLRRHVGRAAGWWLLALAPPSLLCYGLGISALSDGAGLGALLLGGWFLAQSSAASRGPVRIYLLLAGICGGVALGIRPPLLPLVGLALGWLFFETRRDWKNGLRQLVPLLTGLVGTTLAWLVPLLVLVGPAQLLGLVESHVTGHFQNFGGSALGRGDFGAPLAFVDGLLAALGPLGVALSVAGAVGLGVAADQLSPSGRRLARGLLGLWGAYAGFVLLALPLRGHGRHLLPLLVLSFGLVAMGLSAITEPAEHRFWRPLLAAFVLLSTVQALVTARAVWAFRRSLPPGAALARFVVEHHREAQLYGARAARYLDLFLGSGSARPALYLGEVIVDLERRDRLPRSVLVTSEVEASAASRAQLLSLARFCYAQGVPRLLRFDAAPIPAALTAGNRQRLDGNCVELLSYEVRP